MIGILRGRVWELEPNGIVLDVQGVGYEMTVPNSLLSKLFVGQEATVYTQVIVREDDLSLYGFATAAEKALFLTLIGVSGIGPKAGMAILSAFGSDQVAEAIAAENVGLLTKVPGIGKKTAERLVLELREKYKDRVVRTEQADGKPPVRYFGSEALEALVALGYSQEEGRYALKELPDDLTLEEQIKEALHRLAAQA